MTSRSSGTSLIHLLISTFPPLFLLLVCPRTPYNTLLPNLVCGFSHQNLHHADCFVTVIVIPRFEAVITHGTAKVTVMGLKEAQLTGTELAIGYMGGRIFFHVIEEVVTSNRLTTSRASASKSQFDMRALNDPSSFSLIIFLVNGQCV